MASFRGLTEAECGEAGALMKLGSHLTADRAFTASHGRALAGASSDQLVEQFLQETRAVPQTFRMDDLMKEMQEIESKRVALPPVPASTVKDHLNDNVWALQYVEDGRNFNVNDRNHESIWAEIRANEPQNLNPAVDPIWADQYLYQEQNQEQEEDPSAQESAKELLEVVRDDSNLQYSKFIKFMQQVGDGETSLDQSATAWGEEYVNDFAKEDGATLARHWVNEHTSETSRAEEDFNTSFWDKLQGEWKKLSEQEEQTDHPWISEYNDYYDIFKEYNFAEENPMFDVLDPLGRGKSMLESGDLPSAVLCFEAAVKKEAENAEAWQLLGTTQAENEQDPNAICALKRCLELQPDNLTALMALAVSYTNESYSRQACQALVSWIRQNPQYANLVPENFDLSGVQQKAVQDIFIRAAQQKPNDIDYEVQCGLGVLFNLSSEYDKAADCFKAALSVKPNDAKLWNRLGATLANGSRPEEAVDAYHKSLNLEPGFIRARYNVGITCINLSSYNEAAEHFLLALNQQARGKDVRDMPGSSQMSETIWSTLRMCVSLMNRPDLRAALDNRDLETLIKEFKIKDN